MISGDRGDDTIIGGAGRDFLSGGPEAEAADLFVFTSASDSGLGNGNRDVIQDFTIGFDLIDLSPIDANRATAGNQAFSFIGTAAFSGTAGELRQTTIATSTILQADTDGDGIANTEIALTGFHSLTADDFIL